MVINSSWCLSPQTGQMVSKLEEKCGNCACEQAQLGSAGLQEETALIPPAIQLSPQSVMIYRRIASKKKKKNPFLLKTFQ